MLVSGRNNVKEILRDNITIKRAIIQNNFNENDILSLISKNQSGL